MFFFWKQIFDDYCYVSTVGKHGIKKSIFAIVQIYTASNTNKTLRKKSKLSKYGV